MVDRGINERAEQIFESRAEEIASRTVKRLHDHEQVLLGGNALFHVKGDGVTRSDWRHYVSALKLGENHPGILGIGYTAWLAPAEKEAHIREIRAEGFPEYVIRPEGNRPAYTSILWLEPFNWRNQRAFGYDMYTEPVRREAMAEARDTGTTTIAAKVVLVQETSHNQQSGMLMYVPSYRQGMPTDTVQARRAALRGFVYSPIRMEDFVLNTLTELPSDIDFTIHAGNVRSDENLMFSSRLVDNRSLPEGYRQAFSSVKTVDAYGVNWHFTFSTLPPFDKNLDQSRSLLVLLTGIFASFLLGALVYFQARSRRQALAMADERWQSASKIHETMERLKLAAEVAGIGIWTWNFSDDRIEWDTRLYDWYAIPESLRSSGPTMDFWRSRVHPEDIEQAESTLLQARRSYTPWEGKFRIVLPTGRIRVVHGASIIERDRAGKPVRMIGINHDVTAQREMESSLRLAKEAAEEANRAKSEFLANMSHEIRTPMTVFLAALEHLQEMDENPERRQLLEMAEISANRLRSLIEDILDFSRIEARRVDLHEEPILLRSCVGDAVSLLSLPAAEKELELEMSIAPDLPDIVTADQDRLSQVLVNLVGNAVKFTDRGAVKIYVANNNGNLDFAVSDTGPGIPDEKLKLLFQSFSQVDTSRTRRHGGTGLGLAISRGLVELMGGTIRVASLPGQGSTFSFTLPLKVPTSAALPAAAETYAPEQPSEGAGARVLLAEDEPSVREMVRKIVLRRGYRVDMAANGEEAIAKWRQGKYDLILMDMQMPKIDGVEASRTIRRLEKEDGRKPTCIIALTAHARREIKEECLAAGMDIFLTKPVNSSALYAAMEQCLSA